MQIKMGAQVQKYHLKYFVLNIIKNAFISPFLGHFLLPILF